MFSAGSEAGRPSLPQQKPAASAQQKAAASDEASTSSKKNSKNSHAQKTAIDIRVPKLPAAAEESFYTGRGVQPRKTIDGLPVFSLAEMVTPSNRFCHKDH